ncbi:MAG: bacteriohemerythrin [Alphaproteobacteria bacterium]|nr:bacteriohemerythrin [Alphaproteobacteria bacterium]
MTLIEWKEEFKTGIPHVDYEHEQLISLINELHGEMMSQGSHESVGDFLGELFARISLHFALEEKTMRDENYGGFDAHKKEHEHLLDQIRDIMDRHEDGAYFQSEDRFADELRGWFSTHFRKMDAPLHKLHG